LGFGATTVGRTLTATASDAVTQTGAIGANSLTVKTLKNGGAAITLSNAGNDVTTLDLRSRNAADTADAAGALSYTDATALDLAALNTTGTVSITSGGALTQSGALTIGGTSSFTAGANAITLSNTSNALTGAVTLSNSGTNDVSLTNTLATSLSGMVGQDLTVVSGGTLGFGATTVGRTLTATASDAVTQTGAISANSLTVKTLKNGGAAITLSNAGNDVTTLDLRSRNAADTADAAGALSYTDATALDLAALNTTGTVSITSGGALTQSGALTIGGTSSFTAGANAITLSNTSNALTGAVTLSNSGTNDVSLTNTLATSLSGMVGQDLTVVSGGTLGFGATTVGRTLTATASDAVTQTGAISANSLTVKTLKNGGAAITLSNAGNDVTTLDLRSRNAADTADAAGALSYTDATALDLAALNTTGTVSITSGGALTQSGALTVGGTSSFTAGANAITLSNAGNALTGAVTLSNSGTNDASLTNTLATSFSGTVGRNLTVSSGGALTQSGALTVGGTSSFTAGANAITLSNTSNALTGAVTLSNSGTNNVSLTNTLATSLSGTVGQDLTVSIGGTLSFGATTVGRTLTATASDAVTQTGAVSANSLTVKTLKNGGAAITLSNAGNDVTTLDLRSRNAADTADAAGALSYTDATALDLAALNTTGTVSITSGGALTQSGALT
ncbi:hypothetical protein, partial [Azospirillum sp. TSH64]|uniref:beta strand repeat-containing protein n=1 Tax=Azospirillum sp. TSH64 TaxID=652740 RepID=UPI0018EE747B